MPMKELQIETADLVLFTPRHLIYFSFALRKSANSPFFAE